MRITDTMGPIAHGERAGSATAVQLATRVGKYVFLTAASNNAGSVYVGLSNAVTVKAGTTTTTAGIELAAGDSLGLVLKGNLNEIWIICDNAGDDLTYLVLN